MQARFVVTVALVAMISGCLGGSESNESVGETVRTRYEFCNAGAQGFTGGERTFAIRGCPETLIDDLAPLDSQAEIQNNSTGLLFAFNISTLEPELTVALRVTGTDGVILQDELVFHAGRLLDRDVNEEFDRESLVVITELHFSTCRADDVTLSVADTPIASDARFRVISFNGGGEEEESGDTVTCNDYWQGAA